MNAEPSQPEPSTKSVKGLVFLIVLLDVMGLGIIIPVQPFLAQSLGASAVTVTWLGAIYSVMQFICSPMWGGLSDRFGRRPVLLVSLAVTALGHTCFGLAATLPFLFAARALAGTGAANISTAQAVIADISPSNSRGSAMAILGAAFGLGFVLGPALGGFLGGISPSLPAFTAAGLCALNLLMVAAKLPETRRRNTEAKSMHGSILAFRQLPGPLQMTIVTTFITTAAFAIMEHSLGLLIGTLWVDQNSELYFAQALKLTSNYLVVVGITGVFVQGFLVRKLLARTHESKVIPTSLGLLSISLLSIPLLGLTGSFPLFLLSGVLLALGSGLYNPSAISLVSKLSPESSQGLALAINQSGSSLGRIVGPFCAGWLFATHYGLPFATGSFLILIGLGVFVFGVGSKLIPPKTSLMEPTDS
jgi:DHA1 family tetracycline resistance protein-like MFS transporter